jgi:signal transduction histidine kinase
VLDFARTDRGSRPVRPMDLEGPIREVERDFGPFIDEKGFLLIVDIEDRRRVLADADAVKQILLNLLDNAVKYAARAKDRRITLSTRPAGSHTVLSVADHGPGVAEEERGRIFADFYRTGEEMTRETTGAGIGLALVKRLTEGMGGTVEVLPNEGGGAVFEVRLRTA